MHPQWSRDRQGWCRDCPFSKVNQSECVRCWFQRKTCAHTLWEGLIVQTVGHNITLLAEWQWMDSSEKSKGREVDEPNASARNSVEWVKQSAVKQGWDRMTFQSSQEQQILYHDWVSLIVSRFSVFIKRCVIHCCHVTESFCAKWRFARALPARSPRNHGSIADFAVSVLWDVSKDTVFARCHFSWKFWMWFTRNVCGCYQFCIIEIICELQPLQEISEAAFRCLLVVSISLLFLCFWSDHVGFPMPLHHFVDLLDSNKCLMSPAETR